MSEPAHEVPSRLARRIAALGLAGCVVLAVTPPIASVAAGAATLALGATFWLAQRQWVARQR